MDRGNGYDNRFTKLERDMDRLREEFDELPLGALTSAINSLAAKIDTLVSTHLKILHWLVVVLAIIAIGSRSVEAVSSIARAMQP
jgi:hypothetical protein